MMTVGILLNRIVIIGLLLIFPIVVVGQDPLAPLVPDSIQASSTALLLAKTILWVLLGIGFVYSIYYFTTGDFRKGFYGFIVSAFVFIVVFATMNYFFDLL